jgi:maltose-binding protein MalE
MKTIKKIIIAILALVICIVETGCGNDGKKALPGYEEGKINLVFFVYDQVEEYQQLAADFSEVEGNEGINIIISQATDSYYSELQNSYIGSQTPDIVFMKTSEVMPFLNQDLLISLDKYIDDSDIISQNDLWAINNCYRYEKSTGTLGGNSGKLYGLIKDFSPDWPLVYNKAYVSAACATLGTEGANILNKLNKGSSYPAHLGSESAADYALNWTEFYNLALAIKKTSGVNGTILDASPEMQILQWIQMNGDYLFTEDDKQCKDIVNTPAIKSAFEMFRKLQDGASSPAQWSNTTSGGTSQIISGKVGSTFYGRWAYAQYRWDEKLNELGYAPAPLPDNYSSTAATDYTLSSAIGGAMALSITAKCEYLEEAWKFIEYFFTEYQKEQVGKGYNISGNKTLAEKAFLNSNQDADKLALNTFFYNLSINSQTLRYNRYIGTDTIYNIMWLYFSDYFYSSKHDATNPDNSDWISCLNNIRNQLNLELAKHF